MAYLLDGLAILILVFSVWRGGRRGFVRTILTLVGCVAALLVASWLAKPVAQRVYDGLVAPRVEQAIVRQVQEEQLQQMEIPLSSLVGDVSSPISEYLSRHGVPESITVGFADHSDEAIRTALSPAMQTMVRPALVEVIAIAARVLLFLLLLLVVQLVVSLIDRVCSLPVLRQINRVGGWVVGILQGGIWVMIFAAVLQFAVSCGWLGSVVTQQTLADTWLLSRVSMTIFIQ